MPYQVLKREPDACAFRLQKCLTTVLFVAALFVQMAQASFAATLGAPPINVNGSHLAIAGLERDNVVFVPMRGFFEKLGANVTNSGSSFVATRQSKELARMAVGSRSATINGSSQMLPAAPFISGGVAMLPLRVISEAAGASVAYVSSPRAIEVTRSAAAGVAEAAAGGAAAATVAQAAAPAAAPAATDVASAAPVADTQTNESGIPWWLWALIALLVLAIIFWAISRRRKKEPIITTKSSVRGSEPTITTGTGRGSDPTINTRK